VVSLVVIEVELVADPLLIIMTLCLVINVFFVFLASVMVDALLVGDDIAVWYRGLLIGIGDYGTQDQRNEESENGE
jgi:hypothetical protein